MGGEVFTTWQAHCQHACMLLEQDSSSAMERGAHEEGGGGFKCV